MDVELVPLDLATLKVTPSAWKVRLHFQSSRSPVSLKRRAGPDRHTRAHSSVPLAFPLAVCGLRCAQQLTKIALREKDEGLRFRIAVESGGCHGYQYKMDLTNEVEGDD